jgi:DNA-binding NarL/FixJ family response regulator
MDLPHRAPIHLVIMDSERMLLDFLASNLSAEQDFSVVYANEDPQQGIRACLDTFPEVAIIDVELKGRDPFDIAAEIHSRQKKTRFLFLGRLVSDISIEQALRVNAYGFLLKNEPFSILVDSIHRINRGDFCFSSAIEDRVVYNRENHSYSMRGENGLSSLTNRQLEVLRHLAVGQSVREVARQMHLSEKSIDSHKYRIMNKLGIHDRVELARFAIREGLVEA